MKNLVFCVACLLLGLYVGEAKTIEVPAGGDIAAAVAEAEDGDVVQLAAGEYTLSATVTINRPLTVRGVNRLLTTVRASGTGFSLFKLQDPDAVVERMCLAGATASQGPAVYVDTAGGQVLDCLVAGNTSTVSGGGAGAVHLRGEYAVMRRTSLQDNTTAKGYGGGAYITGNGIIDNCLFSNNSASWGGGLYIESSCDPKVVHITATGNTSQTSGGADVYNYSTTLSNLRNSYIGVFVTKKTLTYADLVLNKTVTDDKLYLKGVPDVGSAGYDLYGNPHDANTPSIGCYSLSPDGLAFECDVASLNAFIGEEMQIHAEISNLPTGAVPTFGVVDGEANVTMCDYADGVMSFTPSVTGFHTVFLMADAGDHSLLVTHERAFYAGARTVTVAKETAMDNLYDAYVACGQGGTVLVADGEYEFSKALVVEDHRCTFRSVNGRDQVILRPAAGCDRHLLTLNVNGSVVDGFTFQGGTVPSKDGPAIRISSKGGLVDNCIIENWKTLSGGSGGAMSIGSRDAIVRRTVMRNNRHDGGDYGGAVQVNSFGTLDTCLMYGNYATWGGAIYISRGTSGGFRMLGCTVYDNTQPNDYQIYEYNYYNTFVDCIIEDGHFDYDYVTNCIVPKGSFSSCQNGNVITTKPNFPRREQGDYSVADGDAAIDAAIGYAGRPETDVNGKPRVNGDGADIGAVEHYDAGLIVGFSVDRTRVRAELDESVVLRPVVSGGEVATYLWTVTNAQGVAAAGVMDESGVLTVDPASPGVYSVALEVVGKSGSRATAARDGVFTAGVVEAFVATDGGNVFPYDTEAKAARNFNDAWTLAVSGTVVRVAAGNYLLGQSLDLTDPIRIVGAGREVTELRLAEGVNGRLALLDNAKSSITGCTLAGGRLGAPTGQNGCGVKFESRGGLVEDCRITDCRPVGVVQHGTAVQIVGKGILRRTMIDHCTQGSVASCWGTIRVYSAANAVIDSCLVCSNAAEWGGGIYVEGTAYVTNCTFAANSAKEVGSDLYLYTGWTNARFCNCVFAEAINGNDIHIATGAMTDEGVAAQLLSSFDHCLSESCYVAIGGGGPTGAKLLPTEKDNLNELAGFSDAAAGDYRPGRGSPLLAGGLLVPGMKKLTDLEGHPLVVGGQAPIGCYASPFKPGLLLLIR